jgi:hypothetical protein
MYISGMVICQRGFIQVSAPDSETGKTSTQSRIRRDGARLRLFVTWVEMKRLGYRRTGEPNGSHFGFASFTLLLAMMNGKH